MMILMLLYPLEHVSLFRGRLRPILCDPCGCLEKNIRQVVLLTDIRLDRLQMERTNDLILIVMTLLSRLLKWLLFELFLALRYLTNATFIS